MPTTIRIGDHTLTAVRLHWECSTNPDLAAAVTAATFRTLLSVVPDKQRAAAMIAQVTFDAEIVELPAPTPIEYDPDGIY